MECEYKEYYRLLTKQFIGWLNNEEMINEMFREVATLEDIDDTMSE